MDASRSVAIACMAVYVECFMKIKKRRHKYWVKNWLLQRNKFSHMSLVRELSVSEPLDFKNYLRMDVQTFQELLSLVTPYIQKQNTQMRDSISPEERLIVTLRFLATGRSYECLKFSSRISPQAIGRIIPETCRAITDVLKAKYFKFPNNENEWREIASGFQRRWNFPNCGGAMDGKHIRIKRPQHSGALYYNYKNFYSVVLLAIVNSNYQFVYVDVGKNGRNSEGGIFEYSRLSTLMNENKLNFPCRESNVIKLNFTFLADDAFSLHENILKRFTLTETINQEREVYNYRHARGRNVVENAFGLINARFRVLKTAIELEPKKVNIIVLSICVLHNFLCTKSSFYLANKSVDTENKETHELQRTGEWRSNIPLCPLQTIRRRPPLEAIENRDRYVDYFSGQGAVAWQDDMVAKGK